MLFSGRSSTPRAGLRRRAPRLAAAVTAVTLACGAAWAGLPAGRALAETLTPDAADGPSAAYVDVAGELARAAAELEPTGALETFPGDRLRPDRAITLGEFAHLAARAFGLEGADGARVAPERAMEALQAAGAMPPSASADPQLPMSRLHLLQATFRLAGMGELLGALGPGDPEEAVRRLAYGAGLLEPPGSTQAPPEVDPAQPGVAGTGGASGPATVAELDLMRSATRGEAILAVWAARRWHAVEGTLAAVGDDGRLQVEVQQQTWPLELAPAAVVVRNGRLAATAALQPGDRVLAAVDGGGQAVALAATGAVAQSAWAEQGRQLLRELARQLTPAQWEAILRGDWETLSSTLTPQVYDGLMGLGIAPWEAEALLHGDWTALRTLANRRVADEASRRLGISPQVLEAVMAQDWEAARQLAQQELLQRLIQELTETA